MNLGFDSRERSIVESYLESFTRALKPRFKQLWHIDAFAGRVSRTVRVEARKGDLFDAPDARARRAEELLRLLSTSNQGLSA